LGATAIALGESLLLVVATFAFLGLLGGDALFERLDQLVTGRAPTAWLHSRQPEGV